MIRNRLLLLVASFGLLVPAPARAREIAPGDLLLPCAGWGVTRIEPDTGEQKPLGINGNGAPLEVDAAGLVWAISNRRVFSIERATGDHRFVLEIPQNFTNSTIGDLLAEPGGTLLWAGYGEIWRIDPQARSLTPILSGAPLQQPLGLAWAPNGDLLIVDQVAAALLRWNETAGFSIVASGDLIGTPGRRPTKVAVLPDGDYVVLRNGSPLRIDPDTGAQSVYSANVTEAIALEVAANGDLVYVTNASTSDGEVRRISGPAATPQTLLAVGPLHPVQNARFLALTDDGHAVFGGTRREITDGVVTDSQGALFELDLGSLDFRVLSQAAHNGGLASTPDGRLFVAGLSNGEGVREIDPRTGEMFFVAGYDPLLTEPVDVVREPGGTLAVLNGVPNGDPSITRVDPDTGATSLVTGGSLFVDPEKLAVDAAGTLYVGDISVGSVFAVDPVSGDESVVPGTEDLSLVTDVAVLPSGNLLVIEHAADFMLRIDPATGATDAVGPTISTPGVQPGAFGSTSAMTLGLDGTPYMTLTPGNDALNWLYRVPFDALAPELVSTLPLCRSGTELEVVRAVTPVPEPCALLAGVAALAGLVRRRRAIARFPSRHRGV
jgi:streptogramin lyase